MRGTLHINPSDLAVTNLHRTEETEGGGEEYEVVASEGTRRSIRGVVEEDGGPMGQSVQTGVAQDETSISETVEDTEVDMDVEVEVYLAKRLHTEGRNERRAMQPCKG